VNTHSHFIYAAYGIFAALVLVDWLVPALQLSALKRTLMQRAKRERAAREKL
jgi:heme exporter protein D